MSFRNRCQVASATQVLNLTVPLVGGRDQKQVITDIEINYTLPWQMQHWRAIESCYNKSPFFLFYKDSLKALLFERNRTLWELNFSTIRWVLSRLKLATNFTFTQSFEKEVSRQTLDLRNQYKPNNRFHLNLQPYQQVFNLPFEPNLCILDLLFNLGPRASEYLAKQHGLLS